MYKTQAKYQLREDENRGEYVRRVLPDLIRTGDYADGAAATIVANKMFNEQLADRVKVKKPGWPNA
jgi:hypothetical protein